MTNYESVEPDKVKDIFAEAFAVNKETGEVLKCENLPCRLCLFGESGDRCGEERLKWLDQPVVDWNKDIDWSKVPVDTPVLVWNTDSEQYRRYFSGIKDGRFGAYTDGRTSWSSITGSIRYWFHCKLCRPEDVEKYIKKEAGNE